MSKGFGSRFPAGRTHTVRGVMVGASAGVTVISGLCASIVLLHGQSEAVKPTQPIVTEAIPFIEVMVPIAKIEGGAKLRGDQFRLERYPRGLIGEGIVTDVEALQGKYSSTMLVPGAPVHQDALSLNPPSSKIAPEIPKGFRAVAILVNETTAVAGWAQPGTFVDVLWTTNRSGEPEIVKVAENIKIISAEQKTEADIEAARAQGSPAVPRTVTLATPELVTQKIVLASGHGQLHLSLRGSGDNLASPSDNMRLSDIRSPGGAVPERRESSSGTVRVGGRIFEVVNGRIVGGAAE